MLLVLSAFTGTAFPQANQALSNLATTAVNTDIVPGTDNAVSLGNLSKGFKQIWLKDGLYLGGIKFFTNGGYVEAGNTGIGNGALFHIFGAQTSANHNVAVGYYAMYTSQNSYNNVAIGYNALERSFNSHNNVAIGVSSMYTNTSGVANSGIGANALFNNTSGSNNMALGAYAMYSNKAGYGNIAIGVRALYSNQSVNYSVAIGDSSLFGQVSGTGQNVAIGSKAIYSVTTGYANVGIGFNTLYANTTGTNNSSTGALSLIGNSTGSQNSAFGSQTLNHNTTGSFNTAIGYNAGSAYTAGNNNTLIGAGADIAAESIENSVAIGQGAQATASNQARIGTATTTSIGGFADWSNISDGRFKKNIKTDVKGLEFIQKLRPVTYNLDISGLNNHLSAGKKPTTAKANPVADRAVAEKEKMVISGFVAQEVEKAAKDAGYDFSGVDKPQTEAGLYGLRYSEFVVPLVKGMQQLIDSNTAKNAKIDSLSARLATLADEVSELKELVKGAVSSGVSLGDGFLGQNTPNPVKGSTVIAYTLPQSYGRAKIQITDMNGRVMKTIPVTGSGKGVLTVNTGALSAGTYPYVLYVDGAVVGTKQMLVVR